MSTPVRIAFRDTTENAGDFGPWDIGGAWYVLGKSSATSAAIYKSTDLGVSWVEQDDSNEPSLQGGWSSYRDGTLIHVLANNNVNFFLKTFDTATDTWGALSVAGPSSATPGVGGQSVIARLTKVASGDLYAFFLVRTSNAPVQIDIQYSIYSGGVWSAPVVLISGSPGPLYHYIQGTIVDPNNLIHIFYKEGTLGNDNQGTLNHVTLTIGGVIGTPQVVDSDSTNYYSAGHSTIFGTDILLPYFDVNGFAGVYVGDYTTPVWSFTLVDTLVHAAGVVDWGNTLAPTNAFAFEDGGTAFLIFQSTNGQIGGYTVNAVYYARNTGGGWDAPVLFYNEVTDPGPWYGSNDPDIYAISGSLISGDLVVTSNLDCEGTAFLGSASITPENPLSIVCNDPPDGQVGVPY